MPDRDPLDAEIRELVARAVAETPPAPDIDEGTIMIQPNDSHDRRRWWLGGATVVGAAAALVALFVFAGSDESAEPPIPATDPTTTAVVTLPDSTDVDAASTTAPSSTGDPSTTVDATTTSTTSTAVATTSTAISATTTTSAPTTTTTAPPPVTADRLADVRLSAGPNGVEILGPDGRRVTDEAMSVARLGPDDSVYVQRRSGRVRTSDDPSDFALLRVTNGGRPEPVDLPAPLDGPVNLHDSAVVDGRWVVVLESVPAECPSPEDCVGSVHAWWPDTDETVELAGKIVWEGGWERFSLSETGIVVGAETEQIVIDPLFLALPGTGATAPTPEQLGLEDRYSDCSDCPTGFAIDRAGTAIAWFERDLDTGESIVRAVQLDGTPIAEVRYAADCCPSTVLPVLSLGNAGAGGDRTVPIAIVNDQVNDPEQRAASNLGPLTPVYVDLSTGEVDLGAEGTVDAYE